MQEKFQLVLLDAPLGDLPLQGQVAGLGRAQQGGVVQVAGAPGGQQGANLGQREAEALGALDEAHGVGRRRGVEAVAGFGAVAGRQQPLSFVIAQGRRPQADAAGELADGEHELIEHR